MFKFFKGSKDPQSIEEVLSRFKDLEKKVAGFKKELKELKEKGRFSVQKVGVIRFNPFSGVGGDQSFSAAFLDADNTGVVFTSLFTQEGNRVYGKPIEKGASKYLLSEEEKKAIGEAIKEA